MAEVDTDQLDQLIDDLIESEDTRKRISAARALAELRDPKAIPALARIYDDPESEPKLRAAVADALRVFRAMEMGQPEPSATPGGLPISPSLTRRLRGLLVVLLAITVVANIALVIVRLTQTPSAAQPDLDLQTIPSPRADLVRQFETLMTALETESAAMRTTFTTFQVEFSLGQKPRCLALPESTLSAPTLARIDRVTYPDLAETFDLVEPATKTYLALREDYRVICMITDRGLMESRLAEEGGPTGLVEQADTMIRSIQAARLRLIRAIENPAPTVGPTATPTLPPTETPPPTAPGGEATNAPGTPSAPGEAAAAPSGTPEPSPTPAPTDTPTPVFVYQGLKLNTLKAYRYILEASYEGVKTDNQQFSGSLRLNMVQQSDPLLARYEVTISERAPTIFRNEGWLPANLYVPGTSVYTIVDGILYQTGQVVPARVRCEAFRANEITLARFQALVLEGVIGRLVVANNFAARNLKFESQTGSVTQFSGQTEITDRDGVKIRTQTRVLVDDALQLPLEITLTETREAPKGYAKQLLTSRRLSYRLIGVDAQAGLNDIVVEAVCRGVRPAR